MQILLKALAYAVEAKALEHIKATAKDIINTFFPDVHLPILKIVNHTFSDWLGRCSAKWLIGADKPFLVTIEIQKSILDDEKTLHRVLAHELIHAYEYSLPEIKEQMKTRFKLQKESHGKTFLDMASKMNSVFGAN